MTVIQHGQQPVWRTKRSGLETRTIVSQDCGAGSVVVWEQRLLPGQRIPLHYHEFEETLTVLEGELLVSLAGAQHLAPARSTIYVAAGVAHSLANERTEPALVLAHFINDEPTIIPLPDPA